MSDRQRRVPAIVLACQDACLGMALARQVELQHLSVSLFWSRYGLELAPPVSGDLALVDVALWAELQASATARLLAAFAKMPLILLEPLQPLQPALADAPTRSLCRHGLEPIGTIILDHGPLVTLQTALRLAAGPSSAPSVDAVEHQARVLHRPLHRSGHGRGAHFETIA